MINCLILILLTYNTQIRISLYNISFGESGSCSTEPDVHTGRPRCQTTDSAIDSSLLLSNNLVSSRLTNDDSSKVRELRIYDVPYSRTRVQMACICDNQSIFYNQPLTFQSSSNTLELTFIASKLNITEDFMDLYFYASYEIVRVSDCKRRHKLTSTGGEENAYFNIKSGDSDCNSMAWLLEAKKLDHSLFLQTWGALIPANPTAEDMMKCQTKNRLIIYSGHMMGTIRIICPMHKSESKATSTLSIFSEDWMNTFAMPTK